MASQLPDAVPIGLGVVGLIILGLFLLFKAYFTELGKSLAVKTPDAVQRMLVRSRPVGGRRLRRYRKMVVERYGRHRLGFGEGVEGNPIEIRAVYVPLQGVTGDRRADVYELIGLKRRTVLLGEPGAGKSLLLKYAMLHWADDEGDEKIPVIVDLHQCNRTADSFEKLITSEFELARVRNAEDLVNRALDVGRLRIFFDGLDEVGDAELGRVVKELQDFATRYGDCEIVVTCRNAAYREQLDEHFDQLVRIADFDDASVIRFLRKWPGIDGSVEVGRIFTALQADPELMGLARSPLMLTMIAYLQSSERIEQVGSLPNSRAAFYKIAVIHLLDRDRRLGRPEAIGLYSTERKLLVLERIARIRLETAAREGDWQAIPKGQLENVIRGLLPGFDLGPEHAAPLLDEIVKRSQLIKPLDQIGRFYIFTHLTMLEYLAASELSDSAEALLRNYRLAPDVWRETVRMRCAVAHVGCTPVIREVFSNEELRHKVLALQCLGDVMHIEEGVADEILAYFFTRLGASGKDGLAVAQGLGALAASSRQRGLRVRDGLVQAVTEPQSPRRSAALIALAASGRLEAAGTLAQCAEDPHDGEARGALQSMGEIAVPALSEAARRGAVWAVHSLGAIGTPAAAQRLAKRLWSDDESVASAAAWTLASLLRNPDVEEELRQLSLPAGNSSAETYPAVWNPFAAKEPVNSTLPVVAGRIAYELDAGHLAHPEVPCRLDTNAANGITEIDFRIGIPVAALGAGLSVGPAAPEEWGKAHELAREAADRIFPRHQLYRAANLVIPRSVHIAELLSTEPAVSSDNMSLLEPLKGELLRVRDIPAVYRRVIDLLPWPVQSYLLATCVAPDFYVLGLPAKRCVGWDTWRSAGDNPLAPRSMLRLRGIFSLLALTLAVVLGGTRLVASVFGQHPWGLGALGPGWLDAGALILGFVAVVFLAVALSSPRWLSASSEEKMGISSLAAVFLVAVFLLVLAVATLGQLTTWPLTIVLLAVTACGIAIPAVVAARRNRARANPLRLCLMAGEAMRASP
ncbi:hypothetical protein GCM10010441_62390 [Kitasatospora paracochleata]|uniref:NACHT domain-containing protein n=1 Tax=Kitasatospora paracochleata TaxID=58354 RepID=A0ABT1J1C6_9ACTN|nr:NACHT domain-containing protein [Kitasatospora paracochleata]MCP2310556.1 hypothetical protein [Kitasatospora paracochleata]